MELKIDFSDRKVISGIIALVCIVALAIYLPNIISATNPDICMFEGVCQHEQRVNFLTQLVPVFVLSGIVIGAIVFFFMASRIEGKEKDLKRIAETLVQFLNRDEKIVVQKILEGNGKILQSEISRAEGIGKLKSHRILRRLSDRGVIVIEKHGKTNMIRLAKNIQEVLGK